MARRLAELSQEQAAAQVSLSKMAISKYENEQMLPGSDALIRLAKVYRQPVEFFLRGPVKAAVQPVYRCRATLKGKHEAAVVAQLQEWVERYLAAESLYPPDEQVTFDYPDGFPYEVATIDVIEDTADALREAWGLGDAPIDNLTELLEDRGIKVGIVTGNERFDACLFRLDDGSPVMAVKAGIPGDRQRFCLAHELGHLMLELPDHLDSEKAAYRFAGAFLVPASAAYRELGRRRQSLSQHELHLLKHKYGLSMQAWVYRARDLGIVDEATAVQYFKWFRRNGTHRVEPGDALPAESPQRLTRLVLRAVAEDVISRSRAAELLGMPWLDFLDQQAQLHGEDVIAVGD
jgi:Zn-dependent peptidase ImmA (M78 family)/DNA-binding XRE family transcriptional regulator